MARKQKERTPEEVMRPGAPRMKDVLKGRLDPFLEGWRRRAESAGAP